MSKHVLDGPQSYSLENTEKTSINHILSFSKGESKINITREYHQERFAVLENPYSLRRKRWRTTYGKWNGFILPPHHHTLICVVSAISENHSPFQSPSIPNLLGLHNCTNKKDGQPPGDAFPTHSLSLSCFFYWQRTSVGIVTTLSGHPDFCWSPQKHTKHRITSP